MQKLDGTSAPNKVTNLSINSDLSEATSDDIFNLTMAVVEGFLAIAILDS